MNESCYDNPGDYEIAFSFRDIGAEVDVIRKTISDFSGRKVRRVLQLACGPSQHMVELSRAGFHYVGLDINEAMVRHSAAVAAASDIEAELHVKDMVDYRLDTPVDYAFIALGDLYVGSNSELRSLFKSVARSLGGGGLFLLDWCVQFQPESFFAESGQSWSITRDSVRVDAHVRMKPIDRAAQTFEETLTLDVIEGNQTRRLESASIKRALYPQEFLLFVDSLEEFEFIGWWNDWDLAQPISSDTQDFFRPITLLRRKPATP